MATLAQVQIGIRSGYATTTTCKIVAASLVTGNITISGSWGAGTFTIVPAQIGTDSGTAKAEACFVGSTTITGLSAFTRYTYTATQGSLSSSGSFMTAPSASDDFSFFFGGCDNNTNFGGTPTGFYDKIESYIKTGALPTVGMLFVDDLGYVDNCRVDDSGVNGTGHKVTNTTDGAYNTAKVYDYAIGYVCNLGMLLDSADAYVAFGRDESRIYCTKNMNLWPQWGDHEFANDLGFDIPADSASLVSGSTVSAATIYANAKAAWNAIIKPLQPPSIGSIDVDGVQTPANGGANATTGANHWGFKIGPVAIVAPDFITHSNGTWDRSTTTGLPTVIYGTNQINDILSWLNTNGTSFNILGLAHSIRYMSAGISPFNNGAQHPLYNSLLSEYQRLFTASGNSPASIMDNNKTNGIQGVTVCLCGDYHNACVLHHEKALGGQKTEQFYTVNIGTINGSSNFAWPSATPTGTSYDGTTVVYSSPWASTAHNYAGIRVDVYGSLAPKEMHVILMDSTGTELFHGRWLERSSNDVFPESWVKTMVMLSSSK